MARDLGRQRLAREEVVARQAGVDINPRRQCVNIDSYTAWVNNDSLGEVSHVR